MHTCEQCGDTMGCMDLASTVWQPKVLDLLVVGIGNAGVNATSSRTVDLHRGATDLVGELRELAYSSLVPGSLPEAYVGGTFHLHLIA